MDGNEISLDNFEYQKDQNIFKSISKIKIIDKTGNKYEFSQIYIDTKKKEILGTDTKAFLNDASFKPNIFKMVQQIIKCVVAWPFKKDLGFG